MIYHFSFKVQPPQTVLQYTNNHLVLFFLLYFTFSTSFILLFALYTLHLNNVCIFKIGKVCICKTKKIKKNGKELIIHILVQCVSMYIVTFGFTNRSEVTHVLFIPLFKNSMNKKVLNTKLFFKKQKEYKPIFFFLYII